MRDRYQVIEDPSGIYFLWDDRRMEPVMTNDQILAFKDLQKAARVAEALNISANDNEKGRLHARARAALAWGWLR